MACHHHSLVTDSRGFQPEIGEVMANWADNWPSNKPKFWAPKGGAEHITVPETPALHVDRPMKSEWNGVQNGRPAFVPYTWNGAERYRRMGLAMSLYAVRQRIRAAQRAMRETVMWP